MRRFVIILHMISNNQSASDITPLSFAKRFAIMVAVVAGLIAGSSPTRSLPPGKRSTVLINLLFFVVLGVANETAWGEYLAYYPLVRISSLVAETLLLGWFFSPGASKPASRMLFYVHVGPFFATVLGGAAATRLYRCWQKQ